MKDFNFYGCKVIIEFVEVGVLEEILYVSKLYIGIFKLVIMIEKMCVKIIELGGEICFSICVDDIYM